MGTSTCVLAPGGKVTGGIELLHQLVHELRANGHDAFISYVPFDQSFACPEDYLHYDAPSRPFQDRRDTTVVLPEIYAEHALGIRKSPLVLWWLSVESFLYEAGQSACAGRIRRLSLWAKLRMTALRTRSYAQLLVPPPSPTSYPSQLLRALSPFRHLSQSQYATDFLMAHGIHATALSDYLNQVHSVEPSSLPRHRQIVFNPKKGLATTTRLINAYPALHFVPIAGLSPQGVAQLLASSMVYIDFGHHPGKDRIPREAALAGCIVITGRRGAAGNDVDIPIPQRYKLDEASSDFIEQFGALIGDVFERPDQTRHDFGRYCDLIRQEPEIFRQQVAAVFCSRQR